MQHFSCACLVKGEQKPTCKVAPSCTTVATTEPAAPESHVQVPPVPDAGVHDWVTAKPSRKKNKEPEVESHATQERPSAEGEASCVCLRECCCKKRGVSVKLIGTCACV